MRFIELEQARAKYCWDGKEKGKACGFLPPDTEEETRGNGGAATGDPRKERSGLSEADQECCAGRDGHAICATIRPIGKKQDTSVDAETNGDQKNGRKDAFDPALQKESHKNDGKRRKEEPERFISILSAFEDGTNEVQNVPTEDEKNGEKCSEMKNRLQKHPGGVQLKNVFAEDEVAGTRDGKKFGQSLNDAQNDVADHGLRFSDSSR
jgi:hypothetical protein